MEPLFKNKTTLSKKNYLDLVQFHQKKNNWKYWLYTAIVSTLFIVIISFQVANHTYLHASILAIFFIGFLIYRFFGPYFKIGKELKSDKIQDSLVNYYLFYNKYFRVKNKFGNSKIKYYKLYRVYENEKFFYLYLDKNYAFILEKSGFVIGNIDSFKKFIKNKMWLKFRCIF